jgi:HEPN domain-containing protein
MRPSDEVRRESVKKWIAKVGEDLETAVNLQNWPFRGIIPFHAQQAVEKYINAFPTRHEIEFPKTHDIGKLLDLLATVDVLAVAELREAETQTPFGVEIRYPDESPECFPVLRRAS